jgi:molecular chaperone DnaK (HSP70)
LISVPSVVAVHANGHISVGHAATACLERGADPAAVVGVELKRIIGRLIDDPYLEEGTARWTNEVVGDGFDCASVAVPAHDDGRERRALSPIGAAVAVLCAGRTAVLREVGVWPRRVVAAVPAHFTAEQRAATSAAFRAAGMDVLRYLTEPEAAAWSVLHECDPQEGDVDMIFDMGGGTFDVAVVRWTRDCDTGLIPCTLGVGGDSTLGGMNIDEALLRWASGQGGNVGSDHVTLTFADKGAYEAALWAARGVKEAVCTTQGSAALSVEGWAPVVLSPADVARACAGVVASAKACTAQTLMDNEVAPASLCRVVHVGGASACPSLREAVHAAFPGARHVNPADPGTAVARGAHAVGDHMRMREAHVGAAAYPAGLGGTCLDAVSIESSNGTLHPLVPMHAMCGVSYKAGEFTTQSLQDAVSVRLVLSAATLAFDPAVEIIGTVVLNFPMALPNRLHSICITARVEQDGSVGVSVYDRATKVSAQRTFHNAVRVAMPGDIRPVRPPPRPVNRATLDLLVLDTWCNTLENYVSRVNRALMEPAIVAAFGGPSTLNPRRFELVGALASADLFCRFARGSRHKYSSSDVADALGRVADFAYKAAAALHMPAFA